MLLLIQEDTFIQLKLEFVESVHDQITLYLP